MIAEKNFGRDDLMVLAAFRHCIDRQTYIVGDCADWLSEMWPHISDRMRSVIRRELEEEFAKDDDGRRCGSSCRALGDDCYRVQWEKVRALWRGGE